MLIVILYMAGVARYILEVLFENEHPDIAPPLTDEETGRLYLTLKTVVDAVQLQCS